MMMQTHHFLIRNVAQGVPAISLDRVVPDIWSDLADVDVLQPLQAAFQPALHLWSAYICKTLCESLQKYCRPSASPHITPMRWAHVSS